jgi:hypothetical protein
MAGQDIMSGGREEKGRAGSNVANSVRENKQQDKKLYNERGRWDGLMVVCKPYHVTMTRSFLERKIHITCL